MHLATIQTLDRELRSIAASERRGLVQFLRCLDLLECEDGFDLFKCNSPFEYLVKEHHLAEGTAWRRVTALRLIRRFPQLEAMLEDGRLNLTQLGILSPVLTPENVDEVVREATHRTKRQTEELAVSIVPRKAPAPGLRKVPSPRPSLGLALPAPSPAMALTTSSTEVAPSAPTPAAAPVTAALPRPPTRVTPVSKGEWLLSIRLDEQDKRDLDRLRDLLAHQIPDGDPVKVFRQMLRDSLDLQGRKRGFVAPDRKRKPATPRPPTPGLRVQPTAETRRVVLERDGYRCTWRYPDGSRCECTRRLEMDHLEPAAETGSSRPEDLTTRCREHNMLRALRRYGREYVRRRIEEARRERERQRSLRQRSLKEDTGDGEGPGGDPRGVAAAVSGG